MVVSILCYFLFYVLFYLLFYFLFYPIYLYFYIEYQYTLRINLLYVFGSQMNISWTQLAGIPSFHSGSGALGRSCIQQFLCFFFVSSCSKGASWINMMHWDLRTWTSDGEIRRLVLGSKRMVGASFIKWAQPKLGHAACPHSPCFQTCLTFPNK